MRRAVSAVILMMCAAIVPASAAERCSVANGIKECVTEFAGFTVTRFADRKGRVTAVEFAVPDTSAEASIFVATLGTTMARLAPGSTQASRDAILADMLRAAPGDRGKRLGDYRWRSSKTGAGLTIEADYMPGEW